MTVKSGTICFYCSQDLLAGLELTCSILLIFSPLFSIFIKKYRNEFNTNVAMAEIYKYAKRYRSQVSGFYSTGALACLGREELSLQ